MEGGTEMSSSVNLSGCKSINVDFSVYKYYLLKFVVGCWLRNVLWSWIYLVSVRTGSPRRLWSGTIYSSIQQAASLDSGSSFFAGVESEFSPWKLFFSAAWLQTQKGIFRRNLNSPCTLIREVTCKVVTSWNWVAQYGILAALSCSE